MVLRSAFRRVFAGSFVLPGLLAAMVITATMVSTGCVEVSDTPTNASAVDGGGSTGTVPATGTGTTTPTAAGDDLDLSRVTNFFIPSTPGVTPDKVRNASVTAKITAASTDGDKLYTSYEHYPFPNKDGVDAVAYFFYVSGGTVMGGKFDWWKAGGQPIKTLENVHLGYGGHKMPGRGTECWTMISSVDGSQRSNTRKVVWK